MCVIQIDWAAVRHGLLIAARAAAPKDVFMDKQMDEEDDEEDDNDDESEHITSMVRRARYCAPLT